MQKKWWEEVEDETVQPAGSITVSPPDPRRAPQLRQDQAAAQAAAAAAPYAGRKAAADAAKAEADAEAARIAAARAGQAPDPGDVNPSDPKNRMRIANLNALVNQINRVEELYQKNIAPTSGLGGVWDFLPAPENKRFDAATAALADQGLASFRTPGVGSQSDRDAIMFERANMPKASSFDVDIEEKLRAIRQRVDESRAQFGLPPAQWYGQGGEQPQDRPPTFAGLDGAPPP